MAKWYSTCLLQKQDINFDFDFLYPLHCRCRDMKKRKCFKNHFSTSSCTFTLRTVWNVDILSAIVLHQFYWKHESGWPAFPLSGPLLAGDQDHGYNVCTTPPPPLFFLFSVLMSRRILALSTKCTCACLNAAAGIGKLNGQETAANGPGRLMWSTLSMTFPIFFVSITKFIPFFVKKSNTYLN